MEQEVPDPPAHAHTPGVAAHTLRCASPWLSGDIGAAPGSKMVSC